VPHYLWKSWEGGKVQMLTQELDVPIVDKETKRDRLRLLVDYFTARKRTTNHDLYALRFFLCEALNLINAIGQIYLMDAFLGGEFSTYGRDVMAMSEKPPAERDDPMAEIFPKVAKCTFHKYGPSGTVERLDGICVMPLNIVNEKIYIFLWFWFILLSVVTGVQMVYRLATLVAPGLRAALLRARARLAPNRQVDAVCRRSGLGDWFLLYQLGKNIDPLTYR